MVSSLVLLAVVLCAAQNGSAGHLRGLLASFSPLATCQNIICPVGYEAIPVAPAIAPGPAQLYGQRICLKQCSQGWVQVPGNVYKCSFVRGELLALQGSENVYMSACVCRCVCTTVVHVIVVTHAHHSKPMMTGYSQIRPGRWIHKQWSMRHLWQHLREMRHDVLPQV